VVDGSLEKERQKLAKQLREFKKYKEHLKKTTTEFAKEVKRLQKLADYYKEQKDNIQLDLNNNITRLDA
jgi:hypothetical protein